MTLRFAIEDAILEAAPDVVAVEAVGLPAPEPVPEDAFIPLPMAGGDGHGNGHPVEGGWHAVGDLSTLAQRTLLSRRVSGRSVLFCRMGDNLYAYGAECPACRQSLASAALSGTTLACPSCGLSYDVIRAGRGLDRPGQGLEPFPLLVEQDEVRIALPA
jgi:nitrite reductase/ring-hydroxylating ferredoxin subunit